MRLCYRAGTGRPLRVAWELEELEELGVEYEPAALSSEECAGTEPSIASAASTCSSTTPASDRLGRSRIDGMDGSQPGDPGKAATAIIRAVGDAAAPLHLALGDDAVDAIRAAQDGRRAELEAWEQVSRSTAAQPCR